MPHRHPQLRHQRLLIHIQMVRNTLLAVAKVAEHDAEHVSHGLREGEAAVASLL